MRNESAAARPEARPARGRAENRDPVDQRRARVRDFLAEHAEALRRQGSVVETWRERGGRRLGPYYRLACRLGGRQKSVYLGSDRRLAVEVRRDVAARQAPARDGRRGRLRSRILRRELRRCRAVWDAELAKVGLRLKGSEVRGGRSRGGTGRPLPAAGPPAAEVGP